MNPFARATAVGAATLTLAAALRLVPHLAAPPVAKPSLCAQPVATRIRANLDCGGAFVSAPGRTVTDPAPPDGQ